VSDSAGRIERDRRRFNAIVRGRIKRDLERYVTGSELIGRKGGQLVSIPVPRIELPRIRHGDNSEGQGGGEGQGQGEGSAGEGAAAGAAGSEPGQHLLEVELTLDEMASILGEELELPNIQPRGRARVSVTSRRWSSVSNQGPRSLRHMRRTLKESLKREIAAGSYDPNDPRLVPAPDDLRYRASREITSPDHAAMILYMMDVSGSMGREQKEIVRLVSFWIDTWLRSQYQSLETRYLVHDATAKQVDQDTFYRLRESGGTKISSAYQMASDLLENEFPQDEWNVYLFHFSDGDNWSGRDTERCLSLLRERLLPRANMFCYGQVKSAYGSGQFMKDLGAGLAGQDGVISCEILDRAGILPAIKTFLGKGL
jgi:uncharacterized sporulation protein YeaH/YhbH (DUF444 family)